MNMSGTGRRPWRFLGVWGSLGLCLALQSLCAARHQRPHRSIDDAIDASELQHVVVSDDTLWDVVDAATGKPWVWPKVWAMNPQITNPHWLHPGDVVHFKPGAAPTLVASAMDIPAANEATVDHTSQGPRVEVIQTRPPPSKQKRDMVQRIYTGTFVTGSELAEAGRITNALDDKLLLRPGDQVYLMFKKTKTAPKIGDRFLSYRILRQVDHPITHKLFGYMTEITGMVVIDELKGDVARGKITSAMREIERDQFVTPAVNDLMVSITAVPTQRSVDGVVVAVEGDLVSVGEQQMVFIDKGKRDGLQRGNQLFVRSQEDQVRKPPKPMPAVDVATLLVVEAKEQSSSALVVDSLREVWPGDPVRSVGPKR